MNKKLLAFILMFSAPMAFSGGWTFIGQLSHVVHIQEHVLTLAFISFVLLITGLLYQKSVKASADPVIPDRGITLKNLLEKYGSFIMDQAKAVIGEEEGPKYFVFLATLFLFILVSNLIGLIPGFLPPTENLNTTLALGVVAFVFYNIKGCKELGTVEYIKHFAGPIWYMGILIFPIEIISHCVRPLSLALRLRGNMAGDHMVLGIFSGLVPQVVPVIFMLLGVLVSCIQAYVFTMLTMVYISLAVAHHDHDEHHAH